MLSRPKLIYSGNRTRITSTSSIERDEVSMNSNREVKLQSNAAKLAKHFGGPPTEITPIEVKLTDGGFESSLKKFKVLFQRERVLGLLKEKQAYEKPSEKKRRKRREAKERKLLTESRERMIANGEWEKRQKRKAKKRQQRMEQRVRQHESSENLDGGKEY